MEEYELGTTQPGIRSDTDGLKIWLFALYTASILHTLNNQKKKNQTNKQTVKSKTHMQI